MSDSVLRHLRDVLIERRQPSGQEPIADYDDVSALYPAGGENAIRRFERRETSPKYRDVDPMVHAYAKATKAKSVFDLWDEAIRRAKKDAPLSDEESSAEALQFAADAAQATQQDARRSPSSQSPKVT